ncbi:MAG TPA: hypothetical protein PK971_06795, partial [Saprospiraceae bacterium]|nr:hypothetical protein [Saprospiraceae bacterium]
ALRKALALDSTLPVIYTNLPIALLMQPGHYEEAKAMYLEYSDKPYRSGTYRQVFLSDLLDLQEQGISHPDFKKIEKLLKGE